MFSPTTVILGTVVAGMIGRQIAVHALSKLSMSTLDYMGHITCYENENVNKRLQKLDTKIKIQTVHELFKKGKVYPKECECCIYEIKEILVSIEEDFKKILIKLDNHKNKWFSSWRTTNCSSELELLEFHINILDSRLTYLIKVMSICKNQIEYKEQSN